MGQSFFERFAALCKQNGETPNAVAKHIGVSSGSVTAWKNGTAPRNATVKAIANYFGVSTDYLLENEEAPAEASRRSVSDDDIKFALFGGDGEITDAMYDEVRNFAEFVKQREAQKHKE